MIQASELDVMKVIGQGSFGTPYKAKWNDSYVLFKTIKLRGQADRHRAHGRREEAHYGDVWRGAQEGGGAPRQRGAVLGRHPRLRHIGLVTELPAGRPAERSEAVGRDGVVITESIVLRMTLDIICGLRYLHESTRQSHGRLKSTNVMIDVNWRCKLSDYGLGPLKELEAKLHDTENQGSLLWLAPELLRNQRGVEGDVYAFGIILFELLYRGAVQGIERASLPLLVSNGQRPTNTCVRGQVAHHVDRRKGQQLREP